MATINKVLKLSNKKGKVDFSIDNTKANDYRNR